MSAQALPITPARFSDALTTLSLSSLYLKAAELRNSILHLEHSNAQLEEFVRDQHDRDCYEAIVENREVVKRFRERIELIKREVTEGRGLMWQPEDGGAGLEPGERGVSGDVRQSVATNGTGEARSNGVREQTNGTSGIEEEEGVFL